jgi:TRAP-type C4-dicarboxylate transport system substrate-binding protein
LAPSSPAASANVPVQVKIATILPRGLAQDNVLKKLEEDWAKVSGGAVILKRAPTGQKDGEAGIVRKLRTGNYQAGLLAAVGLSEIEHDVSALQFMPLTFQDWDEVDFVREKIRSRLEDKLRAKGFIVLFWADSGWVNFFSSREGATPADFKAMKLGVWAGSNEQVDLMKAHGYKPVTLEPEDFLSGFGTHMIDAAPIAPTFALGCQIQTVAPYVLDMNWCPIVGAAIIRKDVWEQIPADTQKKLLALCEKAGADIRAEGRRFHNEALETLGKGPKTHLHHTTPAERAQWEKLCEELAPDVRGKMVPSDIYQEVTGLIKEYRTGKQRSSP